ncbi:MAG: YraN family protein [Pseudomonadota bacterium]
MTKSTGHDAAARRKAEIAGRRAEQLAALALRFKGCRILAQRFRAPVGEVDIVAQRGRLLIFAEVKTRHQLSDAVEAVTGKNRRRVERAADAYLARNPHLADCSIRYDIIAVSRLRIRHLTDAWRPDP